jgi:hypothetical protein
VRDRNGSSAPNYSNTGAGKNAYQRITIIGTDNENGVDNFANWSESDDVALIPPGGTDPWWNDPNGGSPRNFTLEYNINSSYFGWLSDGLLDGGFGFGIDPDCHYFNSGIEFTIVTGPSSTPPVPVPAAASLAAIGLAGLAMVIWGKRFLARPA